MNISEDLKDRIDWVTAILSTYSEEIELQKDIVAKSDPINEPERARRSLLHMAGRVEGMSKIVMEILERVVDEEVMRTE